MLCLRPGLGEPPGLEHQPPTGARCLGRSPSLGFSSCRLGLPPASALLGRRGLCLRLPRSSGWTHWTPPPPAASAAPPPSNASTLWVPLARPPEGSSPSQPSARSPFLSPPTLSILAATSPVWDSFKRLQTGTPASQVPQPPAFPHSGTEAQLPSRPAPTPKPSSHAPGTWPHLPSAQPCSASQVSLLHPRCSACALCKRPLAWNPPSSRVHRTESCLSFRAWLCFQAPEETGLDSGQNALFPEPRGMRFPVLGKLKRGFSTENEVRTRPPLVNRVCSWHLGHKRCCPGPLQQWGRHA